MHAHHVLPAVTALTSLFSVTSAQTTNSSSSATYVSYANTAANVLTTQWWNSSTGLWENLWWQSANILTAVIELADVEPSLESTSIFYVDHTWTNAIGRGSGGEPGTWLSGFYDDEGWWALAWIAAYDLYGNATFLSAAETLFADMTNGWTTPCGGGIWWDKAHTQVAAIANELFLSVAAHLANRVSDATRRASYLDWALREHAWFESAGFYNEENLVNDGLDPTTCANNGGTPFTYNQGVLIGALVELARATGDTATYLTAAAARANATLANLTDAGGVLTENSGEDIVSAAFKGVFVRNLKYLQAVAPRAAYRAFLATNAAAIWNADREVGTDEMGPRWQGPFGNPSAAAQGSALDCFVAAAAAAAAAS